MYKSPIEILYADVQNQFTKQMEEDVYKLVVNYFPNVDKDELIRALQYDRQQYEQGYADGKRDAVIHARWDRRNEDYCCTNCGAPAIHHDLDGETVAWYMTRCCPDCGARMDAEEP